jgi:hypothetical protein
MSVPYSYLFSQLNTLHIIKTGLIVFTVTVLVKKIRIDIPLVKYNKNFVWLYECSPRQYVVTGNNISFTIPSNFEVNT